MPEKIRTIVTAELGENSFLATDADNAEASAQGCTRYGAILNLIRSNPGYGISITDLSGSGLSTPTRGLAATEVIVFYDKNRKREALRAKISGSRDRNEVFGIDAETAVVNLISGNPEIFGLDLGLGGNGHSPQATEGTADDAEMYGEFTVEHASAPSPT